MADGNVEKLAVVVDADYAAFDGRGRETVHAEYRDLLSELGYRRTPQRAGSGAVFVHEDGLPSVGLWIMPDNRSDGMLEDSLSQTVARDSHSLFEHARDAVKSLPNPLFDPARHGSKAVVATWLSWQRMPGKHIVSAVGERLLDLKSDLMRQIRSWLEETLG